MTTDVSNIQIKLDAWEKHEKIAMHFNDLILKLRIQALAALAALITIGGVLLKAIPSENTIPWGIVATLFAVFLVFWIAIWLLDFKYYNLLLLGAVDYLLKLEDEINSECKLTFDMSHKIEDSVLGAPPTHRQKGSMNGPKWFYSIVTGVLIIGFVYSLMKFICTT